MQPALPVSFTHEPASMDWPSQAESCHLPYLTVNLHHCVLQRMRLGFWERSTYGGEVDARGERTRWENGRDESRPYKLLW
jgi:hypothetical protein